MSVNVVLGMADRAADLAAAWPVYAILLGVMFLDILSGVAAAIGTKTLSSKTSWKGLMKKVLTLIVVALCVLIQPIIPGGVPLGTVVALFFIASEGLSILENAGRLGVLPPMLLRDALADMQHRSMSAQVNVPAGSELTIEAKPKSDALPGGQRRDDPPA